MTFSRRDFLQSVLTGSTVLGINAALPALWSRAGAANRAASGETILVVIQLSGGNDGLNTVIPFIDEIYRKARPKLAIAASDVLKIDGSLGFHPSMRGMADLLENQRLAIVQGVGYPNPNRSHFESMDIWHTCRRKTERRETGWLGRFLDLSTTGGGDAPAIHLGDEKQPIALSALNVRTPSIRSLERFRLRSGGRTELEATISEITRVQRAGDNDLLAFVQSSTTAALQASKRVEQALQSYKTDVAYPQSGLGEKLKVIAQLIDSGLQTRVYYVALDGFDTHSQQAEAHAGLVEQLAAAMSAFDQDLQSHGHGDRVLTMAFSEFGRRVSENASEGTDHGAAAPLFLAGGGVQSGLIGKHPSLTDLDDGDLKHHTDFRSVYATILDQWLKWPSEQILGEKFTPIAALK